MTDTNPSESFDAEGIPDLEDQPPGIDIDLAEEATMAPREYPVAAGTDPAYATTATEEATPETVADRVAREEPDVGADELGVGGGAAGTERRSLEVDDGPTVVGSASAGTGPEAMDEAIPVDDIQVPPLTDEVATSGPRSTGGPDLGYGADEELEVERR
ncbi:MAG TPA: hypothetical protein VHU17_06495 [Acidimicrobiales bacterium]|nr:hypothetical protein [Acidimicrobiales bacterium]